MGPLTPAAGLELRPLGPEELELFRGLDRSEVIDAVYYNREGTLVLVPEHYDMKGFPPGELDVLLERQAELLGAGGTVAGAWAGERLAGIVSVDRRLFGPGLRWAKMDILHIDAAYRGRGVGTALVNEARRRARDFGAGSLYISATPSENTVNFYRARGAVLLAEPDPDLWALEPEDIHFELPVGGDGGRVLG